MPTSMEDNQIDISHRKDDQFDELAMMGPNGGQPMIAEEIVNAHTVVKKKKGKKGKKGKKKKAAASDAFDDLQAENMEGGEEEDIQLEGGSDDDGPGIFDIEKARTKKKQEKSKAANQDGNKWNNAGASYMPKSANEDWNKQGEE